MKQEMQEHMVLAFEQQRRAFEAETMPTLAVRRDRLRRLREMTQKHAVALEEAISQDFGHRAKQETQMADVFTVLSGARHADKHLPRWMRAKRVPTPMHFWPGSNRLLPQPLGVVGIVSPWNYPYYLAMAPAIAALAAGNRVLIKPSELTPVTSSLMARMVSEAFAPEEMQVILGDANIGRAFTELPFDHLFFTGSTAVGRLVAQAAARNLTPVTLELGGKSPAIVDRSAPLQATAERIAYGKLLNAGQTCVAPDYVLAPRDQVEPLAQAIVAAMRRMFPKVAGNPDYTSIATDRHLARLQALAEEAQAQGARVLQVHDEPVADGRKLPPRLLLGVNDEMTVMREEIFGPLLPIVPYDDEQQAIAYVRAHDRPLALYWFGTDSSAQQRVLEGTHAGGVTVNDCIWHLGQEEQPFGGVGASGMGRYHGVHGFKTFSHDKPVFHQSRYSGIGLASPPYGRTSFQALMRLLGPRRGPG